MKRLIGMVVLVTLVGCGASDEQPWGTSAKMFTNFLIGYGDCVTGDSCFSDVSATDDAEDDWGR